MARALLSAQLIAQLLRALRRLPRHSGTGLPAIRRDPRHGPNQHWLGTPQQSGYFERDRGSAEAVEMLQFVNEDRVKNLRETSDWLRPQLQPKTAFEPERDRSWHPDKSGTHSSTEAPPRPRTFLTDEREYGSFAGLATDKSVRVNNVSRGFAAKLDNLQNRLFPLFFDFRVFHKGQRAKVCSRGANSSIAAFLRRIRQSHAWPGPEWDQED